jgi:uncharacterized membrane protein YcaP (DUF421 family)
MFFFESWSGLGRVLLVGTLAYVALVVLLRISGKRTLSKMNAFDLVVTVAFGSTLATVLLSKDVPLAEGVTAFALLVVLQLVITWLSVRSDRIQQLVKAQPTLLLYRGRLLRDAMRRERITEEEIRAAVRSQGIASLDDVDAVVIETEGTISVMSSFARKVEGREAVSTLATVRGWPAEDADGERG